MDSLDAGAEIIRRAELLLVRLHKLDQVGIFVLSETHRVTLVCLGVPSVFDFRAGGGLSIGY